VVLTSTDLTELTVPSSVTVLAGQIFSRFSATLPEDDELDGLRNVRLIASAPGFSSATNVIPVEDNDPHHFVFNAIASPQTSAVPFLVSLSARDVNDTPIVYNDGRVLLSALAGTRLLPLTPSQVTFGRRGSWSGSLQVNSWGTNVQIKAAASHGVFSLSNPFLVVPPPWSGPPTILTQDGYFGLNKGKFGFSFRAEQGSVAVVEASTNLTDWLPLQTNLLGEWEVQFFEDLDADRFTRRFYRLQVK